MGSNADFSIDISRVRKLQEIYKRTNSGTLEIEARFYTVKGEGIPESTFRSYIERLKSKSKPETEISEDEYYKNFRVTEIISKNGKEIPKKERKHLKVTKESLRPQFVTPETLPNIKYSFAIEKTENVNPGFIQDVPFMKRRKERISFVIQKLGIKFDLTEVTEIKESEKQKKQKKFEFEIEILDISKIESREIIKVIEHVHSTLFSMLPKKYTSVVSNDDIGEVVNFFNLQLGKKTDNGKIVYNKIAKARDLGFDDFTDDGILNPKVKYTVALKADGVQTFAIFFMGNLYLLKPFSREERDKLRMVGNFTPDDLEGTILVGELLNRDDFRSGVELTAAEAFVPYDIISYKDNNYIEKFENYLERLSVIRKVFPDRTNLGGIIGADRIEIIWKNFYELGIDGDSMYEAFRKIIKDEKDSLFNTDGFIVTPIYASYVAEGQYKHIRDRILSKHPDVGKIKPFEKMTIDFLPTSNGLLVFNDERPGGRMVIFKGTNEKPFNFKWSSSTINRDDVIKNGLIVEFRPIKEGKNVVYVPDRIRDDKKYPNKLSAARDIWTKAQNPIPTSVLLGEDIILMRKNNNLIKRELLKNVKKGDMFVDIGSGKGGDLGKWIYTGASQVLAIEPNDEHIREFKERLETYEKKGLKTQVEIMKAGGEESERILNKAENFFIFSDVNENTNFFVIMMLSLSFFWKNRKMLNSLAVTIESLRTMWENNGGNPNNFKFIYFTIEGNATRRLMDEHDNHVRLNKVDMTRDGDKIYIDIQGTIVEKQTEYLVYLNDLWRRLNFLPTNQKIADQSRILSDAERIFSSLFVYGVASRVHNEDLIVNLPKREYDKTERLEVDITKGYKIRNGMIAKGDDSFDNVPYIQHGMRRIGTIDMDHSLLNSLGKLLDVNYRKNQDVYFRAPYFKTTEFFDDFGIDVEEKNPQIANWADKLPYMIVVYEGNNPIIYGKGENVVFLNMCSDGTYEPLIYYDGKNYNYVFNQNTFLLDNIRSTHLDFSGFPLYSDQIDKKQLMKDFKQLEGFGKDKKFEPFGCVEEDYEKFKGMYRITDYFSQRCRMKGSFMGKETFLSYFIKHKDLIESELEEINYDNVMEYLFQKKGECGQCTLFNTTVAKRVLETFKPKRWLDPSSGWGDRLIAALAYGKCDYVGVDPSNCMNPVYKEIIEEFKHTDKEYGVIKTGFEDTNLPSGSFDLVFTSPPFFDLEIYEAESKSQSVNRYKSLESWKNNFVVPLIEKSNDYLEFGGHLILYISNYKGASDFIKNYIEKNVKTLKYKGPLCWETNGTLRADMHLWEKIGRKFYPELRIDNPYGEGIKYYSEKEGTVFVISHDAPDDPPGKAPGEHIKKEYVPEYIDLDNMHVLNNNNLEKLNWRRQLSVFTNINLDVVGVGKFLSIENYLSYKMNYDLKDLIFKPGEPSLEVATNPFKARDLNEENPDTKSYFNSSKHRMDLTMYNQVLDKAYRLVAEQNKMFSYVLKATKKAKLVYRTNDGKYLPLEQLMRSRHSLLGHPKRDFYD